MSAGPIPTPTPTSKSKPPASPPKTSLDLSSALGSVLRAWLVSRDSALWVFVSGVDEPLSSISLEDAEPHVHRMNQLREIAIGYAKQIAEQEEISVKTVLQTEINRVLDTESPKFLLDTESVIGSF